VPGTAASVMLAAWAKLAPSHITPRLVAVPTNIGRVSPYVGVTWLGDQSNLAGPRKSLISQSPDEISKIPYVTFFDISM